MSCFDPSSWNEDSGILDNSTGYGPAVDLCVQNVIKAKYATCGEYINSADANINTFQNWYKNVVNSCNSSPESSANSILNSNSGSGRTSIWLIILYVFVVVLLLILLLTVSK